MHLALFVSELPSCVNEGQIVVIVNCVKSSEIITAKLKIVCECTVQLCLQSQRRSCCSCCRVVMKCQKNLRKFFSVIRIPDWSNGQRARPQMCQAQLKQHWEPRSPSHREVGHWIFRKHKLVSTHFKQHYESLDTYWNWIANNSM